MLVQRVSPASVLALEREVLEQQGGEIEAGRKGILDNSPTHQRDALAFAKAVDTVRAQQSGRA